MRPSAVLCSLGAVVVTALSGCGDGSKGCRVTGTVTYRGVPLKVGSIDFRPEVEGQGQPAGTEIKDGKFAIPAAGGLRPGKYRVSVSAVGGPPPNPAGDKPAPPPIKELPAIYNSQTKLRAEVTPDGPNEFTFDLK
jgi:hypothetical protein